VFKKMLNSKGSEWRRLNGERHVISLPCGEITPPLVGCLFMHLLCSWGSKMLLPRKHTNRFVLSKETLLINFYC
jgi:hypothetical protein